MSAEAEIQPGRDLVPSGTPLRASGGRRPIQVLSNYGIVLVALALGVALSLESSAFLTTGNIANLLDEWAPSGIMAAGMTIILIGGGFDLSAGSTFALSGIVAAEVAMRGHTILGFAAGILVGVLVGLVNAILVSLGRINAFVATLSTGFIVGGINLGITHGLLVAPSDTAFGKLGQTQFLGLTTSVYIMAATVLVMGFVLHRTIFGRRVYAIGGNAEAARLSGLRVQGLRALTYVLMGCLAGLAGVVQASRVGIAEADSGGLSLLFNVFAIVIVGGTSLLGGEGAMWRTVVGIGVLAMIGNAFVLLNLTGVYQQVFFGLIILIAVGIDAWARAREAGGGT